MQAKLIVIRGRATRKEIPLTQLPLEVGRNREAGLPIAHDHVSRSHCELFERDGKIVVRDKGSANGTYVNEQRVDERALEHGDKLRIGPLTFMLAYAHGKKKVGSEIILVDELDLKEVAKPVAKPAAPGRPTDGSTSKAPALGASPAAAAPKPAPPAVAKPKAPAQPSAPAAPPAVAAKAPADARATPTIDEGFDPDQATPSEGVVDTPVISAPKSAPPKVPAPPKVAAPPAVAVAPDDALPIDPRKTESDESDDEESQDSRAVMNDGPLKKKGSFVTLSLDDIADDDSLVIRGAITPPKAAKAEAAPAPAAIPAPVPKPAPAAKPAPAPAPAAKKPAAPAPAPSPAKPAAKAASVAPDEGLAFLNAIGAAKSAEPDEAPAAPKAEEKADEKEKPGDDDPLAFFRSLK